MPILNNRYRLPRDIFIHGKEKKFLFLNPNAPDWIITNSNGAAALKLCNGKRKFAEINSIISKSIGRDVKDELTAFFEDIVSHSNLFFIPERELSSYQPCNLHVIHLNLTSSCNLECIYCYAQERNKVKERLKYEDYLRVIDSINSLSKGAEIVLTGGEPLLSSHALDLASYAKQSGNKVHILTNGTLIDESNASRIAELSDLIQVSLDGSTVEINDALRGSGSFLRVMKAVDLLLQKNASLRISMTVTKKNINDIENMVSKFGSLLSFAPLFKAGRAKVNKQLAITGKEYYKALFSAQGVNPLSYLCSSLDTAKKEKVMKCAIGDAEISISDSGDVYPCHLLHVPQFRAGNIKEASLESIYRSSDVLKSCGNLTVLGISKCLKCPIRFICGGACRARAFYEKGRIDVSDDFCEYEKLAFVNGLFDLHSLD
jgi:radical SAM protein with 4Fe4S-binding SPASM domain